jgi:hypothetical protein
MKGRKSMEGRPEPERAFKSSIIDFRPESKRKGHEEERRSLWHRRWSLAGVTWKYVVRLGAARKAKRSMYAKHQHYRNSASWRTLAAAEMEIFDRAMGGDADATAAWARDEEAGRRVAGADKSAYHGEKLRKWAISCVEYDKKQVGKAEREERLKKNSVLVVASRITLQICLWRKRLQARWYLPIADCLMRASLHSGQTAEIRKEVGSWHCGAAPTPQEDLQ